MCICKTNVQRPLLPFMKQPGNSYIPLQTCPWAPEGQGCRRLCIPSTLQLLNQSSQKWQSLHPSFWVRCMWKCQVTKAEGKVKLIKVLRLEMYCLPPIHFTKKLFECGQCSLYLCPIWKRSKLKSDSRKTTHVKEGPCIGMKGKKGDYPCECGHSY